MDMWWRNVRPYKILKILIVLVSTLYIHLKFSSRRLQIYEHITVLGHYADNKTFLKTLHSYRRFRNTFVDHMMANKILRSTLAPGC